MATPTHVYADIASRYGVDPDDEEAVDKWFNEILPMLPVDIRAAIFEELLARDGERGPSRQQGGP